MYGEQSDIAILGEAEGRTPVHDFDFYLDPHFSAAGSHLDALNELAGVPPVFWSNSNGGISAAIAPA